MGRSLDVKNHVLSHGYEYETSAYGDRINPVSGKKSFHAGEDLISSKYGADYIIAYQDGKVISTRNSVKGYSEEFASGNYICISHAGGYETRYFHLKPDSLQVETGQTVKKGQVIAFMGGTGMVTGVHLHFQVHLNGDTQNPVPYLTGEKSIPAKSEEITPPASGQKFKIGDNVVISGQLYGTSAAEKPGKTVSNIATKITRYTTGAAAPYNTTGDLGWMKESSIKLAGGAAPVPAAFTVGEKVKIKSSAGIYSRTTTKIPEKYKNKPYTIQQVGDKDVLLKELYSWVLKTDISKV